MNSSWRNAAPVASAAAVPVLTTARGQDDGTADSGGRNVGATAAPGDLGEIGTGAGAGKNLGAGARQSASAPAPAPAGEGIDEELLGEVTRADGTGQPAIGGRPAYRHAEDTEAGDVEGQGVGGAWYAVAPDGKPAGAPKKQ